MFILVTAKFSGIKNKREINKPADNWSFHRKKNMAVKSERIMVVERMNFFKRLVLFCICFLFYFFILLIFFFFFLEVLLDDFFCFE